ncbi:TOBE domain-containing protein [Rhizobium sp. AN80A]|uniref:TOBE domain-containing protein n=1 Tax=Rhizobium sp. AN80A TaxID=3040673 RepID=UPI0024B35389|nr:TOBE domain-containing protein [Rhizobium sp. AN80A]
MGRGLAQGIVEARFRPEAAQIHPAETAVVGPGVTLEGEIAAVSYPGGHWRHAVHVGDREIMADATRAFEPGERVRVHVPADALFLFNSPGSQPANAISRVSPGKVHA